MIHVYVYGSDLICPSCVHLPSSKETTTWLEAILARKYGTQVEIKFVDIDAPKTDEESLFATRVIEEEMWYPVIVIENEVVDEGNPRLTKICQKIEEMGIRPIQ